MERYNFDEVLDTLDDYGIILDMAGLDGISEFFCENDYTSHHRDFELFQAGDGSFMVNVGGEWHTTKKVLS